MDVRMNHREFTTESNSTSDSIMRFYNTLANIFSKFRQQNNIPGCSLRVTLDRIR
jgi:hypothetical protein